MAVVRTGEVSSRLESASRTARDRKVGGALFCASLFLFLLTDSGHVQTIDVNQSISVSQAIVDRGRVWVAGFPPIPGGGVVLGQGGHYYAAHDVGLALVYLPVSVILRVGIVGPGGATFLYTLLNPIFGAGLVSVLFFFVRDLTSDTRAAMAVGATAALCTILWPYTHLPFDATPTAFFVLVSVYALWKAEHALDAHLIALSAACAASAVLFRVDASIVAFVETIWLVSLLVSHRRPRVLSTALAWVGPLAVAGLITAWYNFTRFGSIVNNGHTHDPQVATTTPVGRGALGMLVSPGKGLIFFAAPLLIATFGWRDARRRSPRLFASTLAILLIYLGFEGRFANWSGAEAWGPRFLVPCLALLLLPLGFVFMRWLTFPRSLRALFCLLLLGGTAVQIVGSTTNDVAVDRVTGGVAQETAWHSSQIWTGWQALNRSLHGVDPYPSTSQGGIVPPPVPRLDVWWAGGFPAASRFSVLRWAIVGLLVVGLGTAVSCCVLLIPRRTLLTAPP